MSLEGTIEYRAIINATESGQVVAAVANKSIVVTSLIFSADAAGSVAFTSGDGGDPLTGLIYYAADSSTIFPHNYGGYFATAAGEGLYCAITTALTINASFTLSYRLV